MCVCEGGRGCYAGLSFDKVAMTGPHDAGIKGASEHTVDMVVH